MLEIASSIHDRGRGRLHAGGRDRRRRRGALATLLAGLVALALPVAPAFGEGSVTFNTGDPADVRQALSVANPDGTGANRSPLSVYARAGETVQMASSLMGHAGANIRIFAPGADPTTATPLLDCVVSQPGAGQIATRAEELAGPLPSAGGYDACDFAVPADGIYTVIMYGPSDFNGGGGTISTPNVAANQGYNAAMWDVTVRDAGGDVQPGRLFSPRLQLRTVADRTVAAGVQSFVYTRTGYEYQVNFYEHGGVNWALTADDKGVVDTQTRERIFASFACGNDEPTNNQCQFTNAVTAAPAGDYPIFFNRVDPVAISGPGGLGETLGYSTTPISPASNPLAAATFTGSGGQAGATNLGAGGTISFTSPQAMESLGYTVAIDTNRDGTFGNGTDFVDDTGDLAADGSNTVAWNGRDGAGAVPACGDYPYQIRSSLSEVHFTMSDVENSGGTRIERLSLPGDPALGDPLAASYDNRDPYKNGYVVTNGTPAAVTNGTSGPGFNQWSENSGNTDLIDTWSRLPEVTATGTLRLLCADVQVEKSADPSPAVPGETVTFRLAVTNNGPDPATDVVVTDDLPDTVTFESAGQGCTEAGGTVTCGVAALAPGATHTFEIVVGVPSSVDECLENTATVTNGTPDINPGNNASTVCVPLEGRADLSITKEPSRTTLPAGGGQVMYTLVIENHGPSDDPGVEVLDPMAAGLTLVAAEPSQGTCTTDANTVSCELGALRSGGSAQVLVTANTTAAPGEITNRARVRGATEDPDPSNNEDTATVTVRPPTPGSPPDPRFDLVVTKTASHRSVRLRQPVRYRIVVANNGPDAAPGVSVTDTLNAPARVVSVRTTAGECTDDLPVSCELGTIAAGESVTIRMTVRHLKTGRGQRNAASATGEGTDADPSNNMDTAQVRVRKVLLAVTKVASRSVVGAGERFSYRIRVRNRTRGVARRVRVCDRLPRGLVFVGAKPKARVTRGRHCWTIKRLKARQTRTFRVRVRALQGTRGRKVNRVTATSPDARRARAKRTVRVRPGGVRAGGVTG